MLLIRGKARHSTNFKPSFAWTISMNFGQYCMTAQCIRCSRFSAVNSDQCLHNLPCHGSLNCISIYKYIQLMENETIPKQDKLGVNEFFPQSFLTSWQYLNFDFELNGLLGRWNFYATTLAIAFHPIIISQCAADQCKL